MLTSFVLHRDRDPSRYMREAYRRFSFVHVLATGASCTHDLDSNIFEVYEIIRAIGSRFLGER